MRDVAIEKRGALRVLRQQSQDFGGETFVIAAGTLQKCSLLLRRKIRRCVK